MSDQYPVLVEGRTYHLIWVEADNAEEAAAWVNEDSEYISRSQPYDGDWTASTPDADDYSWTIYGHGGAARKHDAHVRLHEVELSRRRAEARKVACAAAGHPNTTTYSSGAVWCKGCSDYLKDATAVRT